MPLPQQLPQGRRNVSRDPDPRNVTKFWSWLVLRCARLAEEPFDELSAWISGPTLTRHSHLMSTHRGFFYAG